MGGDTIINIRTLNIGAGENVGEIVSELARGESAEALRDRGEHVPPGAEEMATAEEAVPIEDDEDRLQALEEISERDAANALARRTYLIRLIEEIGRQRKLEGFEKNHEVEPDDREAVEIRSFQWYKVGKETLARACAVCPYSGECPIEDDTGKWGASHAYANSDRKLTYSSELYPDIPRSEGRMKFLRRLKNDPLAHCVPPKPEQQQEAA